MVAFSPLLGFNLVALGLGIINVMYWIVLAVICQPQIGNKFADLLLALAGPLLASTFAALMQLFILGHHLDMFWLIGSGLLSSAVYVAALFVVDRPKVLADIHSARAMFNKRGSIEANG